MKRREGVVGLYFLIHINEKILGFSGDGGDNYISSRIRG